MPVYHGGSVLLVETLLTELHTTDEELGLAELYLAAARPYLEELDARRRLVAELWTRVNEVETQLDKTKAELKRARRTATKLRTEMARANGAKLLHEAVVTATAEEEAG